jgi:hypothetical protein
MFYRQRSTGNNAAPVAAEPILLILGENTEQWAPMRSHATAIPFTSGKSQDASFSGINAEPERTFLC